MRVAMPRLRMASVLLATRLPGKEGSPPCLW